VNKQKEGVRSNAQREKRGNKYREKEETRGVSSRLKKLRGRGERRVKKPTRKIGLRAVAGGGEQKRKRDNEFVGHGKRDFAYSSIGLGKRTRPLIRGEGQYLKKGLQIKAEETLELNTKYGKRGWMKRMINRLSKVKNIGGKVETEVERNVR